MNRVSNQLVRWGIRSGGGLLANLLLLTLWVDYVGIPAWIAILPNWVLLSTVGYVLTDRWVFANLGSADTVIGHVKQFLGSETIMVVSKMLNYGIYLGLLSVVDYRLAWVIGAVASFGLTFAGNRWWWRRRGYSTSM